MIVTTTGTYLVSEAPGALWASHREAPTLTSRVLAWDRRSMDEEQHLWLLAEVLTGRVDLPTLVESFPGRRIPLKDYVYLVLRYCNLQGYPLDECMDMLETSQPGVSTNTIEWMGERVRCGTYSGIWPSEPTMRKYFPKVRQKYPLYPNRIRPTDATLPLFGVKFSLKGLPKSPRSVLRLIAEAICTHFSARVHEDTVYLDTGVGTRAMNASQFMDWLGPAYVRCLRGTMDEVLAVFEEIHYICSGGI